MLVQGLKRYATALVAQHQIIIANDIIRNRLAHDPEAESQTFDFVADLVAIEFLALRMMRMRISNATNMRAGYRRASSSADHGPINDHTIIFMLRQQ